MVAALLLLWRVLLLFDVALLCRCGGGAGVVVAARALESMCTPARAARPHGDFGCDTHLTNDLRDLRAGRTDAPASDGGASGAGGAAGCCGAYCSRGSVSGTGVSPPGLVASGGVMAAWKAEAGGARFGVGATNGAGDGAGGWA